MPLAPQEHRWIARIDNEVGQPFDLSGRDRKETDRIRLRLDAVEPRSKALWGFVGALGLALFGGVGFHLQRVATLEAELKTAKEGLEEAKKAVEKAAESARAEIKDLARELHEHERRAGVPRPEPAR